MTRCWLSGQPKVGCIEANTPGSGDYLYLKINANNNRTLRLNWWLN